VTVALGGSTSAVLHPVAIAEAARIKLHLDDFTRIGRRVPLLADLRPSGRYAMSELIAIGGIQPLMRTLLEAGLLHGECLTVTGRSLAKNLALAKPYPPGQRIVRPLGDPLKASSHIVILYGRGSSGMDQRLQNAARPIQKYTAAITVPGSSVTPAISVRCVTWRVCVPPGECQRSASSTAPLRVTACMRRGCSVAAWARPSRSGSSSSANGFIRKPTEPRFMPYTGTGRPESKRW